MTPEERTMSWTHNICQECWFRTRGKQGWLPEPRPAGDLDTCCYCGRENHDGIYVRVSPENPELTCRHVHQAEAKDMKEKLDYIEKMDSLGELPPEAKELFEEFKRWIEVTAEQIRERLRRSERN